MAESSESRPSKKRAAIPSTHTIHKRPPLRPAIPSPYSGRTYPKVVYVKANTPFISAIKRVQKLLELIEKRDQPIRGGITDKEILARGRVKSSKQAAAKASGPRLPTEDDSPNRKPEEVYLKGTGKAIQRALELGLWFQQRQQYCVKVTTGEVGVVDDIEQRPGETAEHSTQAALESDSDVRMEEEELAAEDSTMAEGSHIPETRIRKVSMVQIAIGWR